jgi:hypothetical protein
MWDTFFVGGAFGVAALYLPGPFAGYVFGTLIEAIGWSTASLFMWHRRSSHSC